MNKQQILETLNNSLDLPMLSGALTEVFSLLSAPNALHLTEIAEKIAGIDGMQEMLLENLSSSYFPFLTEKKSLRDLLVFMGLQNINVLLIALITKQLLPSHLGKAKDFDRAKYWKHSLGTAVGAKMIAELTGQAEKYTVFAYGLIHDIGVAVMDICLPEILDEVCHIQRKGVHQVVADKIVMNGVTHEELSGWLCAKWKLPVDIQSVVSLHHRPLMASSFLVETQILHLADCISTDYYENLIGIKLPMAKNQTVMNALGLSDCDMDSIRDRLPAEIEKVNRILVFN